jgi:pyridoxine/pyridoxamine 5'-phosphate oxidase
VVDRLVRIKIRHTLDQRQPVIFPNWRDGSQVGLKLRYNRYTSLWLLWWIDLDQIVIHGPATLVPGIDLALEARYDTRIPRGELFVYSADRSPPSATTIDESAFLFYRPLAGVL